MQVENMTQSLELGWGVTGFHKVKQRSVATISTFSTA